MSWNLCLSGESSELVSRFYPPIELSAEKDYVIGLTDLECTNVVPNITRGCDKFYYIDNKTTKAVAITLPEGSYEIDAIASFIESNLNGIKIKANVNTMKVEITSDYDLDFSPSDSIGKIIGFSPRKLKAKEKWISDIPVDIFPVSVVRVECNLVTNSYIDGKPSHTIMSFPLTVDPGYRLNITPSHILFLPINRKIIDELTLRFVDQNGKLINFRGETISVTLHLKEA